jgi:hypothetical protein
MADRTWHHKAKEIMAAYSLEAYRAANIMKNGKARKRHVPYSVPEICVALAACLDRDDEHEAKRLFEVERLGAWTLI